MTDIFLGAAVILTWFMCCMFVIGLKARDKSLMDIAFGTAFRVT